MAPQKAKMVTRWRSQRQTLLQGSASKECCEDHTSGQASGNCDWLMTSRFVIAEDILLATRELSRIEPLFQSVSSTLISPGLPNKKT
jgi:hypothetical protein